MSQFRIPPDAARAIVGHHAVSPDVIEQFRRDAVRAHVTMRLAGAQTELLAVFAPWRITDWLPAVRIFPAEDDRNPATIKSVRQTFTALDASPTRTGKLSYLV